MDQTATLVNEYNNTEQQLVPLQGCENEMHGVDLQVSQAASELRERQALFNKAQQDDQYLRKRIHRNENPRFLHYFVFNRAAKVERLKGELQLVVSKEQDLTSNINVESANLSNLQHQQQNAHAVVDRKHQLEARSRALFEQIVDAQPPTQALQSLRADVQRQGGQLRSEQGLLQVVGGSVAMVKQGLSKFQEAERLYRKANSVNEQAKQVNSREAFEERRERREEAFGNECSAECAELRRERLERQERLLQSERDSLINKAHDVAVQAYRVISQAFSSFPMEARGRYPQLCTSIGSVAFPRLEGADFSSALVLDSMLGTVGAAINDFNSGCKIQRNLRVVEECACISSSQLGQMIAMESAVSSNVQQLQAHVQSLEQGVATERVNIFNAVRQRVMQG